MHFPEPVHDVVRATKYFLQPDVLQKYAVDPGRICVSGDSAGGNMAAVLSQQVPDCPQGLAGACVIMPRVPHTPFAWRGLSQVGRSLCGQITQMPELGDHSEIFPKTGAGSPKDRASLSGSVPEASRFTGVPCSSGIAMKLSISSPSPCWTSKHGTFLLFFPLNYNC